MSNISRDISDTIPLPSASFLTVSVGIGVATGISTLVELEESDRIALEFREVNGCFASLGLLENPDIKQKYELNIYLGTLISFVLALYSVGVISLRVEDRILVANRVGSLPIFSTSWLPKRELLRVSIV